MKTVTFHVLEGVDKGRIFRDLSIPVTIGREEGNQLRLNDERISRFHAKVQQDNGDIILTDLESTNGTRVNGSPVSIRRLKPGDQIGVGRSTLLFGTLEEIALRNATMQEGLTPAAHATPQAKTVLGDAPSDLQFDMNIEALSAPAQDAPVWVPPPDGQLPPLPLKLTPAQAARIAEILDFLHRGLACAAERIYATEDGSLVRMPFGEWQKIQAVQFYLARYLRGISDPDALTE